MNRNLAAIRGPLEELQQQSRDVFGLLLLHPVAGARDEVTAVHVRAGARRHSFIDAGALIGAPILLTRDEAGWHVDGTAGPCLQFGIEGARGAAAIPLQTALESGALIFARIERKLAVRQPSVGRDLLR